MDDLLRELGERVRHGRTARGWALRELAEHSGLSVRFLGELERGEGNVSVRNLAKVAEAIGTTPDHLLRPPRRSIALVGLRGAGKSTVGGVVAKRLARPFVELDREIERRAGMSLAELFPIHGEEYYRRLQRETLRDLFASPEVLAKGVVVATGGSLPTDPPAFDLLREHARIVWLRASPEEHLARVAAQGDRRPTAGRRNALGELRALLEHREPLYARADRTVETSARGVDAVVAEVLAEADPTASPRRGISRRAAP